MIKEYIKEQTRVLKDFCVWDKMTPDEKKEFKSRKTEISIDNGLKTYINKYL